MALITDTGCTQYVRSQYFYQREETLIQPFKDVHVKLSKEVKKSRECRKGQKKQRGTVSVLMVVPFSCCFSEVQLVVLANIATMSAERPVSQTSRPLPHSLHANTVSTVPPQNMFEPYLKSFFVHSHDPTNIKLLKVHVYYMCITVCALLCTCTYSVCTHTLYRSYTSFPFRMHVHVAVGVALLL